jgi:hypothetical protein
MDNMLLDDKPQRRRRRIILTLVAFALGLPVGGLVGRLAKLHRIPDLAWGDVIAGATAFAFLFAGLAMALLAASARGRAVLADPLAPDFGRPVMPAETVFFRLQAGVLVLAGLMLAAPVVFAWTSGARTAGFAGALMAAVVACFVLQTALNVLIWRRADEVFRQVIAETGALCFWLLQGLYFLWAAGVKLHVLPEITSWDAVAVLMAAYLILASVVAYRRGLG